MRASLLITMFVALLCTSRVVEARSESVRDEVCFSRTPAFLISLRNPSDTGAQGMLEISSDGSSRFVGREAGDSAHQLMFSFDPRVQAWSRRAPFTPMRTLCASPNDPGCSVSAPPLSPSQLQLAHAEHGLTTAPVPLTLPLVSMRDCGSHPPIRAQRVVSSAFIQVPWRPPAV